MKCKVLCLVGPSGSGKTAIANGLASRINSTRIKTTTTRKPRPDDMPDAYYFVTKEEFNQLLKEDSLLEHSEYAGEFYGTPKFSVDVVISEKSDSIAVVPIDINGAKAYKEFYGDKVCVMFVQRNKQSLIEAIIGRDIPVSERAKRLINLEKEYENINDCDCCIVNNGDIETTINNVVKLIS